MRFRYFAVLATVLLVGSSISYNQLQADIVAEVGKYDDSSKVSKIMGTTDLDASEFSPSLFSTRSVAENNLSVFKQPTAEISEPENELASSDSLFGGDSGKLTLFDTNDGQSTSPAAPSTADSIALYEIKEPDSKKNSRSNTASGLFGVGSVSKESHRFENIVVR